MARMREAVGPLGAVLDGVKRIAVLRGGGLGDALFAVPALWALRETYPEAEITLLGTPLHAALFEHRPEPVQRVEVLPAWRGLREGREDRAEVESFVRRLRTQRFDLAVQVHGGGRHSNPFLLRLGARHTVGTGTQDAAKLEYQLPYLYYQHEVLRALEVVGLVGATTAELSPQLHVTVRDRLAAAQFLARRDADRPLLVVHPGASDPRRRWPPEHFAAVVRRAIVDGFDVDIVGTEQEGTLAETVVKAVGSVGGDGTLRCLSGQLSLGALVGLLERADVMVGNDSGPRHLAQAVGTPTVGIYWAGNAIMAAPLGRARHRLHVGWTTACPVCGVDVTQVGWTAPECEHVFALNDAVCPADVYADVLELSQIARAQADDA